MGNALALKSFYSGKNVAITGGCGFVGSHLAELMVRLGANVVVLDDLSRGVNHLESVETLSNFYKADVSNFDSSLFWFKKDIFAVFNLAASVAGVLHNESHNLDMYNENILLQTVPVAAAEAAGVPHFLQTSTVCTYSPENNAPSLESLGMRGIPHQANGGYAEAKRDGERAIEWANLRHAVIVRPSNIFGPKDHFDEKAHVIPALIKRVIDEDSDELLLYGPPDAIREFVYVEDVAMGMAFALAFGENGEAYNIGCNDVSAYDSTNILNNVISMENLARIIIEISDKKKRVVSDPTIGGGDNIRWADARKLHGLGWEHKVDLEWGLYETIEYYINSKIEDEL
jgi:GDP-L-fucose synthase